VEALCVLVNDHQMKKSFVHKKCAFDGNHPGKMYEGKNHHPEFFKIEKGRNLEGLEMLLEFEMAQSVTESFRRSEKMLIQEKCRQGRNLEMMGDFGTKDHARLLMSALCIALFHQELRDLGQMNTI